MPINRHRALQLCYCLVPTLFLLFSCEEKSSESSVHNTRNIEQIDRTLVEIQFAIDSLELEIALNDKVLETIGDVSGAATVLTDSIQELQTKLKLELEGRKKAKSKMMYIRNMDPKSSKEMDRDLKRLLE